MMRVAINSLSIIGQAKSLENIEECFSEIVECLKRLLPALEVRTAELIVDASMEERSLLSGEAFLASINHVRDNDTKRQWFLYVKNRAKSVSDHIISVLAGVGPEKVKGRLPNEIASGSTHWISFKAAPQFRCGLAQIANEGSETIYEVRNAERHQTVEAWLPDYEPSDKHKPYDYQMNGEVVSRMDLSPPQARAALRRSILVGECRYGVNGTSFYKFPLTRVDGETHVFHGYQIQDAELPAPAIQFLKNQRRQTP